MPMDFKRNLRQICVCACLLMMSGVFALCVCLGKREDTTIVPTADYIVCLRDHDDVPFDVVKGEELRVLLRAGDVLWYEEDAVVPLLEAEDGSSYYEAYQWNLAVIGAQTAFDLGAAGQGIRVGVVDSGVNPHTDSDTVSGWARDAFRWAVAAGVIKGVSPTLLSPKTEATRAQVATMLMRFSRLGTASTALIRQDNGARIAVY